MQRFEKQFSLGRAALQNYETDAENETYPEL